MFVWGCFERLIVALAHFHSVNLAVPHIEFNRKHINHFEFNHSWRDPYISCRFPQYLAPSGVLPIRLPRKEIAGWIRRKAADARTAGSVYFSSAYNRCGGHGGTIIACMSRNGIASSCLLLLISFKVCGLG